MWSRWLVGCVVAYGLLPRALAFAGCVAITRRRLGLYKLDTHLPGLAELRPRLMPESRITGIDAPAPGLRVASTGARQAQPPQPGGHNAIVGLELPADIAWPPPEMATLATDLGRIDSRAQRAALEATLTTRQFDHLIVLCDGRQTPDRGTVSYVQSLSQVCKQLHLVILSPERADAPNRTSLWQNELDRAGIDPGSTYAGMAQFRLRTRLS